MRALVRLAAAGSLLLTSLGATPSPGEALAQLDGHWNCAAPGARAAERSYFVLPATSGRYAGRREIFGRQDTTEPDGAPSASFERIDVFPDGHAEIESVEGRGTAADAAAALHFTGRSYDGDTPMGLTYAVSGGVLHRTATRGPTTVADERCTLLPAAPAPAVCDRPYVPPAVLTAVQPNMPLEAYQNHIKGTVYVRVVLDDRSRVVWVNVVSTASALVSAEALRSARDSTYRTKVVECRPVGAEYIFSVEFE